MFVIGTRGENNRIFFQILPFFLTLLVLIRSRKFERSIPLFMTSPMIDESYQSRIGNRGRKKSFRHRRLFFRVVNILKIVSRTLLVRGDKKVTRLFELK